MGTSTVRPELELLAELRKASGLSRGGVGVPDCEVDFRCEGRDREGMDVGFASRVVGWASNRPVAPPEGWALRGSPPVCGTFTAGADVPGKWRLP